jgi:hypothetical protein
MDELTKRRLAHNEALFRAVNEEIDDLRASGGRRPYVCECADADCAQTIELTGPEYEAVRATPDRFVVAPGHVMPEVEHVVARSADYTVVEKDVPV